MDDRKEKKSTNSKTNFKSSSDTELLQAGELLFQKEDSEFKIFYNSFLTDKKNFLFENQDLLEKYENFELDKLKAIEVIYIFGDNNQKAWMTDWKGEENEGEIENFLENKLQMKTDWPNVNKLRKGANKENDGEFIVDLLKSIDQDLKPIGKKLIFFDLGWDAYVYTAIERSSQKTLTDKFGTLFHGTEKLIK